jgi:hypothetical protein
VVDPTDPKVGTWVPSGGANLSVPACVGCLDGGGLPARCVCEGPPQVGAFCKEQASRPKGRAGEGEACTALCTAQDYHADPSSGDSSRYRCAAGGSWEHVSGELSCLEGPAPKQQEPSAVWEWLGPVLGGVVVALVLSYFCCRRQRKLPEQLLLRESILGAAGARPRLLDYPAVPSDWCVSWCGRHAGAPAGGA